MESRASIKFPFVGVTIKESKSLQIYEFFKRVFDIFFSLIFLLLGLPVVFLAAVLMQLECPGPVFYLQKRVGLNGRIFHLVKLRSMPTNAENGTPILSHEDKDRRIGRIGRFIRKSKIDELSQFINVLLGHMSVVGPRPERPYFVELFKKQFNEFDLRHTVKPGITGLAQFKRMDAFQAYNRLRLDLFYIEHRSFGFDMKIILHTAAFCMSSLYDAGVHFSSTNGVHPVSENQMHNTESSSVSKA